MGNVLVDEQNLIDIADAIRSKNGSMDRYLPSEMSQKIRNIQTGSEVISGGNEADPIRFYDYDGTLLYSYTLEEVAQLTELPELPAHPGLISDGWNWSLEEILAYNSNVIVGAHYIPDDGSTRMYVELTEDILHPYIVYGQTVSEGILIDWGDGSELESRPGSGRNTKIVADHVYKKPGSYVVRFLSQNNGKLYMNGDSSYGGAVWTGNEKRYGANLYYTSSIKRLELGGNIESLESYSFNEFVNLETVSTPKFIGTLLSGIFSKCWKLRYITWPDSTNKLINSSTFMDCFSLERVTLPQNLLKIYAYAFKDCKNLKEMVFPDTMTSIESNVFYDCGKLDFLRLPKQLMSISSNAFSYCYGIKNLEIPSGIKTIGTYVFEYCYGLKQVKFPAGIVTISTNSFSYCGNVRDYYVLAETPPTISAYTFTGISSECVFHVPKGCLAAYQAAQNWSAYADRMVEMEEM